MDAAVIKLAVALTIPSAIGWFPPIYFGVANVLPMILTLFYYADKSAEYNAVMSGRRSSGSPLPDPTYDFIIVGGGSSGSVLANRLSKDYKVLLLERGGSEAPLSAVPMLQSSFLGRPETDYFYRSVPQNNSNLAIKNGEMLLSSGMGLGGSSILNSMIYIRPSKHDFHRLAQYTNDNRWDYDNMLPYLMRSEGFCQKCKGNPHGVSVSINPKYHNTKGELPLGPTPNAPLVPEFLEALEWGRVSKGDLNAPYYKPIGDLNTLTIKNGRRVTAYQAFIEPILEERISLTVMKYARVVQITFEPGSNQASGVRFERFGKIEMAKASKEVIICAGVFETPKLLLLSGIGPKQDLNALKIPVRGNLPVGRNYQNHVGTILGPFLIDKPLSIITERDINDQSVDLFLQNGTGPLAVSNARASTLWSSTRSLNAKEFQWPDIHVHFVPYGVSLNAEVEYSRLYGAKEDIMRAYFGPVKGQDGFSFIVYPGRPKSIGTVRLRSSNFMDDPLIDPRAFEDPDHADIETTVEAMQRLVYLVERAPSFKRIGARLSPIPFPTCADLPFKSNEYFECYVRHLTVPSHHYTSTAAMGPNNSNRAVVDSELRVLGTKGLRVADASVLPFVTTTNTYAVVLSIAERAADLIIAANKNKSSY